MDEKYQVIDPGVSLADAEDVTFSFNGEHVSVHFTDWQEMPVHLVFENAIGCRWQAGDPHDADGGRFDSAHIVENSRWLMQMKERGSAWEGPQWRHYRLNFNEVGTLDVLCSELRTVPPQDTD